MYKIISLCMLSALIGLTVGQVGQAYPAGIYNWKMPIWMVACFLSIWFVGYLSGKER